MKKYLLVSIILFLTTCLLAQNEDWWPIRTDDIYFYNTITGYRVIKVDSTKTYGDTIQIYTAKEMTYKDWNCYYPGPSWIGKDIKYTNNSLSIHNLENEEFTLKYNANLGDEWFFHFDSVSNDSLFAEITNINQEEIFEELDSIKTITITNNSKEVELILKISKNYGFVNTISFKTYKVVEFRFPDEYFDAELAGVENKKIGITNLTQLEIYDFDIGDEFHTESYRWYPPNEANYKYEIQKIISKEESDSTLIYYKEICNNFGIDTSYFPLLKTNRYLDQLPYNLYYYRNEVDYTQMFLTNNRRTKIFPGIWFIKNNDSCYEMVHADKKKSEISGYYGRIEGLGGNYYHFDGAVSVSHHLLKYFKKKDEEWGNPYDCDEIINTIDELEFEQVRLFPNPAIDEITISFDNALKDIKVEFYSILGELIETQQDIKNNQPIPLVNFSEGTVICKIYSGSKLVSTQKVLIQ